MGMEYLAAYKESDYINGNDAFRALYTYIIKQVTVDYCIVCTERSTSS